MTGFLHLLLDVASVGSRPAPLGTVQGQIQGVVADNADGRHAGADSSASVVGVGEAEIGFRLVTGDLAVRELCQ